MFRAIGHGLAAGAAGTTALNAVTYGDMVLRGRGESSMPRKAIETMGERAGVEIPGEGETRQNRVSALGALTGLATGVGVGAVSGLLGPVLRRMPVLGGGLLVGAAAMAASDVPMTAMGLTDPKKWSSADWLSDAVPHLAYGIVTAATLKALHG
jgi:hypothetical protein